MTGLLIGYARVSTKDRDLTAQKNAPFALGVTPEKTFTDHGLTGANRARPGLREEPSVSAIQSPNPRRRP